MARLGSTELVTELRRQNLYTRERKKKGDAFSFIVRKGEGEARRMREGAEKYVGGVFEG